MIEDRAPYEVRADDVVDLTTGAEGALVTTVEGMRLHLPPNTDWVLMPKRNQQGILKIADAMIAASAAMQRPERSARPWWRPW